MQYSYPVDSVVPSLESSASLSATVPTIVSGALVYTNVGRYHYTSPYLSHPTPPPTPPPPPPPPPSEEREDLNPFWDLFSII